MATILVTGGAGYIGSHTCVQLLDAGYDVVVVDNLCNSCKESLKRVEEITGKKLTFYEVDLGPRGGKKDFRSGIHPGCDPFCRFKGGRRIRSEASGILSQQHYGNSDSV